jgi:hypothetical protein
MTNLQRRQGDILATERKPPLNVRALQRLYHSRQGDYLAKDDVPISKQVDVVSRFNGNFIDWLQARVFKTASSDTEPLAQGNL